MQSISPLRRQAALAICAALVGQSGCGPSGPAAAAIPTRSVGDCLKIAPVDLKAPRQGMAFVPGGRTKLGSDRYYEEEGPVRYATVGDFWIDTHEVTNGEFAAFVRATGYVTLAERKHAGGFVFFIPANVQNMTNLAQWWKVSPDATWRRPDGGAVTAPANYPAVQIAYPDALAYARWRGRDLPTEAEWERAGRGADPTADYAWGHELSPGGRFMANTWQGVFPVIDTGADGFKGRAPEGCFPPNRYGLFDMIGNVWEWVKDPWTGAPAMPGSRVIKGGSFICSEDFCQRFRPSARQPAEVDSGSSHIGFRTVLRVAAR